MKAWAEMLAEVQRQYLLTLIIECHGNVKAMATTSNLNRCYLYRLITKHGLEQDLKLEQNVRRQSKSKAGMQ